MYTFPIIPVVVELLQDIVDEDEVEARPPLMNGDLWQQLKHYNPHVDYSEQLPPYLLTNVLGDLVWPYAHPTSTEEQQLLPRGRSLIYRQIKHEGANEGQVLAMKMKNKTTGEIKQFAYLGYLKNLDKITQEYETIEQIKTEPAIKETKISHFDITDFEGNEKTDVYLANPKAQLMIPVYHAEYTAIPVNKTVKDSVFIYDTIRIAGKDSMNIVKTFTEVSEKEVVDYNIRWNKEFLRQFNDVIRPLVEAAANDGVGTGVVISGIDQEKADLLAKETGLKAEFHTADEKLLKTIMRSNPGIILWKTVYCFRSGIIKKCPHGLK